MKILLGTSIVAFWALMTGILVKREVLDELTQGPSVTYRASLSRMKFPHDERFSILVFGSPVGTLQTRYRRHERTGGYDIENDLRIRFDGGRKGALPLLGEAFSGLGEIRAHWSMELDPLARPSRLLVTASLPAVETSFEMEGWFKEDLFLTYALNREPPQALRLEVPMGALFGLGPAGVGLFADLEVGKTWTATTVDLFSSFAARRIRTQSQRFEVEGRSRVRIGAEEVEAFAVSSRAERGGPPARLWVSPLGEVLRISMTGIEIVRAEGEPE